MRRILLPILVVLASSCMVGKAKMNSMLGESEQYAIMKMRRMPDQTGKYGSQKILIWYDPYTSPWVNKWRYTTVWITRSGMVSAWTVKEEPIPPNRITVELLVR